MNKQTPQNLGYFFPAEFSPHKATWLSWPHNQASWPGKINTIFKSYCEFIKYLSTSEEVHINICSPEMQTFASEQILNKTSNLDNIFFHQFPSNDAWCRDHGPAFLINDNLIERKIIVDWNYNAWGNKYPPFDLDDKIPTLIGQYYNIPVYYPEIIMEGGSVDFNGAGTLITSESCLLNPNRNKHLNKIQIEQKLIDFYGVEQILWVEDGIVGDDTDGHVDDTVRFVNHNTVIAVVESKKNNANYQLLQNNLKRLKKMQLINGSKLNIIELIMPSDIVYQNQLLPASYANFYICNKYVIVPTFRVKEDDIALKTIMAAFPQHEVIGIDSFDIIWGLGSFHCLSQQEPL